MITTLILVLSLVSPLANAEKMEVHKKDMKGFVDRTDAAEKRLNMLKEKKTQLADGPELEEALDEITELHKELLSIRQRKSMLTEHLKKEHPNDEMLAEIALVRPENNGPKKTAGGHIPGSKDDLFDKRLDGLLNRIQGQYMRTAKKKEAAAQTAANGSEHHNEIEKLKKKEILQEDKDKYLKEALKTKIKVSH